MPNNYVLLERTELSASAASVTFANIPQTGYTDLLIVHSSRVNDSGNADMSIQFNGNTSAVYSFRRLNASGSATSSDNGSGNALFGLAGLANGTSSTASTFGNSYVYIPNYTSTVAKSWSYDSVVETNAATGNNLAMGACLWNPSPQAAITSILIRAYSGSNILAGSTFSLYGLAALGTTPTIAPKASGGNRIDNDGTYWYHTFTSSGSFVPQVGLTADVLVVAGGGSGCKDVSGGGGAGGLLYLSSQTLGIANHSVTIGAGGSANVGLTTVGSNGTTSTLGALSAPTGGGGGSAGGNTSGSGGSSGGSRSGSIGTRVSGEGNLGAVGAGWAGGGGGAGGAGNSGTGSSSGAGGVGSSTYSTIGSVTGTGQNVGGTYYYAGGGGGGGINAAGGAGGFGGGGAGTSTTGTNGTANTGGGGGGGGNSGGTGYNGGAGGSGIVIIRYPAA